MLLLSGTRQNLIYLMHDHGISRDIFFGFRQLQKKLLSNSWSKTRQFQLFSTDLPSNFWKTTRLLSDKKYRKLKIYKFIFSEQKLVLWEEISLLAMIGTYGPEETHLRRVLREQLFSKGKI